MVGDVGEGAGGQPDIVVVGCGAIGLPLAVAFARAGRRVVGYDIIAQKVAALAKRRHYLLDEGLNPALAEGLKAGLIRFVQHLPHPRRALGPRIFILCVPTPASAQYGFDSSALDAAMAMVDAVARRGDLICVRATVPIGVARVLAAAHPRLLFAACPDRSLSGRAFLDQFETPHLVGGVTAEAGDQAEALFATLGQVVRVSDPETAEAIKLFANVHRDVAFAQANQFAMLCEAAGIDFDEVRAAGSAGYPRFNVPRAGPVGGPCLTKDVHVLAASPALRDSDLSLALAGRRMNESLATRIAREIIDVLGADGGRVVQMGMAFKGQPPTDDFRGSFAGALAIALKELAPGIALQAWDRAWGGSLDYPIEGARVVVLANDNPEFRAILGDIARLAPGATVFDVTGVLERDAAAPGLTIRRFGEGRR